MQSTDIIKFEELFGMKLLGLPDGSFNKTGTTIISGDNVDVYEKKLSAPVLNFFDKLEVQAFEDIRVLNFKHFKDRKPMMKPSSKL